MARPELTYVETGGGPFILLPMELKKAWKGTGDDDEEESDYDRAQEFVTTVGVLDVGEGKALILGEAEVTAFRPTPDGGVFIQRVFGDDAAQVIAAVDGALKSGKWKAAKCTFPVTGKGKLALFDSAYAYGEADEDGILKVSLAPATYTVERTRATAKGVEAGLVRLRRK